MANKYLHEYDLAEHFAEWEPRKRLLYQRRLGELGPAMPDRRRLLDVGCGNGQFLQMAADAGWAPAGIELNPPAAERARRRGFPVTEGTLERAASLETAGFDVVTSWDVLEHTPTPRAFAQQLRRLVKPDGVVVLTTLNVASLAYLVFGLRWSMVCDDHFTYWNRRALTDLMAREGFAVAACRTFGVGRDFFAVLDRRPAARAAAPGGGSGAGRRWDVNRGIVAAEDLVNSCLAMTGGGVGLSVVLRPLPHAASEGRA